MSRSEIEEKVVRVLKAANRPLSSKEIMRKIEVSSAVLSSVLFELYRKGVVKKVYTDEYDPTRPFDTVSWTLLRERGETKEADTLMSPIRIVLSIPMILHLERMQMLNNFNAIDFFDAYSTVIEASEKDLKVICPVIDAFGMFPIINKIVRVPQFKVRIITELDKSTDLLYFKNIIKDRRLVIADAALTAQTGDYKVKICGAHTKMMIADDKIALVGSFNFSKYHYLVNFDIGFLIYDEKIVRLLSEIFEELWGHVTSEQYRSKLF